MSVEPRITGREHWTDKGSVRLFLWEKAAGASPGPLGTILFVHGSSMASQPTFDLHVPGRSDSSAMDHFARLGYDTWCVDMEGYGRSDKHRAISADIATGADDLEVATSMASSASLRRATAAPEGRPVHRARAVACLLLLALAGPALARTVAFTPDPVDLAAARKEGAVTWYTSTPIGTAQKVANLFQAETAIKVELFRSGGSAVLRRFFQEVDARRVVADVLTVSDPAAASALIKRDLLVPFRPKHFDKVRDEVKDPKGYHVAQRLNLVGIVVRTDKNLPLPRNWTDLTDPRYKGLLVMPDPSYTAIQLMVVGTLSRMYGWEFYQKLRANEIMIVQGHQQVAETLTRGERLIAAEGADQQAWVDRQAGHKVQTIFPTDGAFAIPAPTAVIKGSPHPNAAKALAEFLIGDTVQRLFPGEGIYAARSDVEPPAGNPPLGQIKLIPVDYDRIEKDAKNLKARFNEIYQ